MNYLKSDNILEEKILLDQIPALRLRPKTREENLRTIIFYHGWSSSKEAHRIEAFILASAGYQVILPDANYHGERGALDVYNIERGREYFWKTIGENIEESERIIELLIRDFGADRERIGLMGNSMGAFSAAAIFTKHSQINSLVALNGSCDWDLTNRRFSENLFKGDQPMTSPEQVKPYNPIENGESLRDRPILLLHGKADSLVPIDGQDSFYKKMRETYKDWESLKLIRYDNLNHLISTDMLKESIDWFGKYM